MTDEEIKFFVKEEIAAIYEELDVCVKQLMLIRYFLNNLSSVADGKKADYQLNKILKFKK